MTNNKKIALQIALNYIPKEWIKGTKSIENATPHKPFSL